jgi:toxin-antitoxin system PIN domain toxin
MTSTKYLLDVNALIALADPDHKHHKTTEKWFVTLVDLRHTWAICPFTEAGFVRVTTNPGYPNPLTVEQALAVLRGHATRSGYQYWPISDPWVVLAAPFIGRLFSHRQVTDSYLLGLAVKNNGVLVTFDKGLGYLAGSEYSRNLLVLD